MERTLPFKHPISQKTLKRGEKKFAKKKRWGIIAKMNV
jgi:hypothetical protein